MITDERIIESMQERLRLSNLNGWDQPPSFCIIVADTATWTLHYTPIPITEWNDPGQTLTQFAHTLGDEPEVTALLADPNALPNQIFYGVLFETESWMLQDEADVIERLRPGNYRRIMDFPSATECRTLTYCDITGRMKQIIHTRKTGENLILDSATESSHLTGRVPSALATIVKVAARQMPETRTQADYKALNALIRLVNKNVRNVVAEATEN